MTINEILVERGRLVEQMRALLDKAEAENRDLNGEERQTYNTLDEKQAELKQRADRRVALEGIENASRQPQRETVRPSLDGGGDAAATSPFAAKAYKDAFFNYGRVGAAAAQPGVMNALQIGTDSEGGYIVPEEFETMIVEALQDINELRPLVTTITTAGDRNIPIENTLGAATWTAEEAAYTESDPAFGQVVLGAHKLAKIIKVSEELLQDAFFDLPGYLARNFGKAFGLAEEAAFINGDGSGKPTGMVQGASAGVTTAGATAIVADEVLDLVYSLKRPYRASAQFVANDSTVKVVRKLKDSDNQYLWQMGLQGGEPDRLAGYPILSSDAMPVIASAAVTMLFGDPSYYVIADRSQRVMQRLNELYAENGQVGFRMFARVDGKLTLAEAVKKMTQA